MSTDTMFSIKIDLRDCEEQFRKQRIEFHRKKIRELQTVDEKVSEILSKIKIITK